eukprot:403341245
MKTEYLQYIDRPDQQKQQQVMYQISHQQLIDMISYHQATTTQQQQQQLAQLNNYQSHYQLQEQPQFNKYHKLQQQSVQSYSHPNLLSQPHYFNLSQTFQQSSITNWLRGFNFYFLGLSLVLQCVQAYFMINVNGYDVLFTILYTIFWLILPVFNFVFLLSDETFKYNFLSANIWAVWFALFCQIGFVLISWQLFIGGFSAHMDVNVTSASVTVVILESVCYFIQSVLFVLYARSQADDMGIAYI